MDQIQKLDRSPSYRFQLFQGELNQHGRIEKSKSVGMAYLNEGQAMYTLRLWTFVENRFYLLQKKDDPKKYLVLTREINRHSNQSSKFFWNIVGNGQINTLLGIIEIQFDLFERPIYMNVFPEASAAGALLPLPVEFDKAA